MGRIHKSLLGYPHKNRRVDPFVVGLPGNNSQRSAMAHEGEEFLYVLEGRVDFEYDGEIHHLEVGDTAYFDATHKHRVINPDAEIEAQVICVFFKAWVRIGVTTLPCTSASR